MKQDGTHIVDVFLLFLVCGVALPLAMLATVSGCRPDSAPVSSTALEFRSEIQSKLTMYSAALAESMAKNDRRRTRSVLQRIHAVSTPLKNDLDISMYVLDKHGVTVAARAGASAAGAGNYGNYQIVSKVIQKRKPLQSALYLQGGEKVYIICTPLLNGEKVVGVLILGIGADQLKRSGISEKEFMSLTFSARPGDRP
jgi:hypothetical protein